MASEQPVHFGERDAELLSFGEDVVAPGKSEALNDKRYCSAAFLDISTTI
jgi:hypothetical protein